MLQQTRAAVVIPYYERFLKRFPTIESLARARTESVLRLWAGLGYYSRSRNLHAAAKQIVERHGGRFPAERDAALSLAGIGDYSAAAILSIAYDKPLAVLDGNVARVLARLGAIRGDLRRPATWKGLAAAANTLLAAEIPGDWNQAMMELGATVCLPRAPRCNACPVSKYCRANELGIAENLPAKRVKPAAVEVTIAAAVFLDGAGNTLLMRARDESGAADLFSRMWHFPAIAIPENEPRLPERLIRSHVAALFGSPNWPSIESLEPLERARHTVTYRKITLAPYLVHTTRTPAAVNGRIVALAQVAGLAVSSATRKIAGAAMKHVASSRTLNSHVAAG